MGCLLGCGEGHRGTGRSTDESTLAALDRARIARSTAARFSIQETYRACVIRVAAGESIPRTECGTDASKAPRLAWSRLAAQAAAAARGGGGAAALHGAALLDLVGPGADASSVDRAVTLLRQAVRLDPASAGLLADLSAALLVRAERRQDAWAVLEAVEFADLALEVDPLHAAARHNLALALEYFALDDQAAQAWLRAGAVDPRSGWAREARHRPGPVRPSQRIEARPIDVGNSECSAHAARDPLGARRYGWDVVLGDWSAAVERDDAVEAGHRLREAECLAAALASAGGDLTLMDAVQAIHDAKPNSATYRRLARAHRLFSLGQRRRWYLPAANLPGARDAYAAARRAAVPGSVVEQLATIEYGVTLVYARNVRDGPGERLLRASAARADTMRHSALAARAYWTLATTLLRQGRHQDVRRSTRMAERFYDRIGEREHVGAMQALAAENLLAAGSRMEGWAMLQRALLTLRPFTSSVWRHNALYVGSQAATTDGLWRAAARLEDEDVEATRTGRPRDHVEALLLRARLRARRGLAGPAAVDVRAARPMVAALPSGDLREWAEADLHLADAMLRSAAEPDAAAMLDSAIAFFSSPPNSLRLVPALVTRAELHVTQGRPAAAAADLDRVLVLLDGQAETLENVMLRSLLYDGAQHVTERAVMLHLAEGRPYDALAALEHGRAWFGRTTGRGPDALSSPLASLRTVSGEAALSFTLVGDTLLVWSVTRDGVRLTRRPVDAARLHAAVEQARVGLEQRAAEGMLRPLLATLYDVLVHPVRAQLGHDVHRLTIVADGELATVPFAALYDTVGRAYLVESYVLSVSSSLHGAVHGPGSPLVPNALASARVLLVADPAFEPRELPELERLPWAMAEADDIARLYGAAAERLSGRRARRPAVETALTRTNVFHFAGHAKLDDARPDQSFLVLAADGQDAKRLTAAEIARLDLRSVRLVVLSACETFRGRRDSSAGGFGGLTGAFLEAGAVGVVGSLWRVDDALTRRLMLEYHRSYRESADGAAALRNAQLVLLQHSDSTLRSPAAWSAFQHTGG